MIFITDELGKFEKIIIELAENVGFKECKTIEAIDLFCGISERNDVLKEKDRYYAFIDIPQYWSVRADGLNGAIYDNKTKKANIYFKNPIEKRMVSRVEWIDRNNTVYKVDYYNKYGYMYCSENVSGGNVTVREFYDRNGDIKVLEQTGPKTYTTFGTRISPKSYRGFADYLEAYLKYNKIYDENIWLTSDEILNKFAWDYGNFKISYLPQNRLNSDLTVITRTNTAFRILCSEEQQVNWYKENSNYKCDRVYSYFENNELKFGKKEALTITESDQLEYIEQLINDFPEITFHIAASTIMSDKLTRLDINNNVELYPCITEQKRKELFERCDIYLDINHYRELYNAVNEAMVNNMIILAFDNTAHSKELYPMGNIFESSNYVKMKETLKNIITNNNQTVDEKKGKRTGLTILGYVLVIVALLTVLPVVLPPIFGYHTYLSGTDHTGNISKYGSVVYLKTIDEATYKDGNIVAIESADSSARRVDSYYVDSNDSSAKEIALRDGNGVSYKVVKGQVIAKTPFIGYLSQLCFSAVGIIVTVVIFAAGVVIMMYVNKISKEINTMVEQQTA